MVSAVRRFLTSPACFSVFSEVACFNHWASTSFIVINVPNSCIQHAILRMIFALFSCIPKQRLADALNTLSYPLPEATIKLQVSGPSFLSAIGYRIHSRFGMNSVKDQVSARKVFQIGAIELVPLRYRQWCRRQRTLCLSDCEGIKDPRPNRKFSAQASKNANGRSRISGRRIGLSGEGFLKIFRHQSNPARRISGRLPQPRLYG